MSSKSWSPANSMDRLPVLGGGGGCCCCRRVIPPPLPCLVLSGATSCSLRGGSAGRCLRSAPRSAARTAAALDFGQINFQVWERSGSYGSSSYSPPPPPPPVRRCRGCRRGCPQPRSPIRSPPPPSLPLRTLFPSSGFSPRPPLFFCKSKGGGERLPSPPPPAFPSYRITSCRGAGPSLPRPVPPTRVPPALSVPRGGGRPLRRAAAPSPRPPPQVAASHGRPCPPPARPGRERSAASPLPWQPAAARMYPTVADRRRAAPRRGPQCAHCPVGRFRAGHVCFRGGGAPSAAPAIPATVLFSFFFSF